MCWIGHAEKAKRISKGKTVYKIVSKDLTSEYMSYQYKYGVKPPIVIIRPSLPDGNGLNQISRGYHSYSSLADTVWRQSQNTKVVKCTIPAGTLYYDKDINEEIVSEQLVIDCDVPKFIMFVACLIDFISDKWTILSVLTIVGILLW